VTDLWEPLTALVVNLGRVLAALLWWALSYSLAIAWVAWWLWGVNWRTLWPVLARGAWVVAVLAIVVVALVWSQMAPSTCNCLGIITVPNFWWQLGAVSLLACLTLFCGWLQGVFGWQPAEIPLEPPAEAAGAAHGHH
jgi:hypothetical protein